MAWLAATADLPHRRITDVLDLTGLNAVAGKRVRAFCLGMRQRLGIASALLGHPSVLLLDEPVNGLDPEGVVWIRTLMRSLAADGRTVLVSSHLMSEMALTADHLIVTGRGRLIADTSMADFIAANAPDDVLVRTPSRDRLAALLTRAGGMRRAPVTSSEGRTALISGDLRRVPGVVDPLVLDLGGACSTVAPKGLHDHEPMARSIRNCLQITCSAASWLDTFLPAKLRGRNFSSCGRHDQERPPQRLAHFPDVCAGWHSSSV